MRYALPLLLIATSAHANQTIMQQCPAGDCVIELTTPSEAGSQFSVRALGVADTNTRIQRDTANGKTIFTVTLPTPAVVEVTQKQ